MKKLFSRSYLLILLIALYSCSGRTKNYYQSPVERKDLRLHKVSSFIIHSPADTEYVIGKLRFTFATNKSTRLHAFYDTIKRRLLVSNNQGAILYTIAHKGRGPSELVNVTGFCFNSKNQLVIYDQSQNLIKVFSMSGMLLHSAKQEKNNYPIGKARMYVHHNKIYTATANIKYLNKLSKSRQKLTKSKVAAVYNYKGMLIDTLGQYDPSIIHDKGPNVFSNITIDERRGQLLSTQGYNYRIQIFNLKNGKRLAWFGHKPRQFKESGSLISPYLSLYKKKQMVEGLTTPKGAFPTKKYIFFEFEKLTKAFLNTRNFNKKEAYIAVYDRNNYAYYGDLKLPYILGSVADNKLYLIEDSNPDHFTVGVYEIRQGK